MAVATVVSSKISPQSATPRLVVSTMPSLLGGIAGRRRPWPTGARVGRVAADRLRRTGGAWWLNLRRRTDPNE
jgi:hypothetical protein